MSKDYRYYYVTIRVQKGQFYKNFSISENNDNLKNWIMNNMWKKCRNKFRQLGIVIFLAESGTYHKSFYEGNIS